MVAPAKRGGARPGAGRPKGSTTGPTGPHTEPTTPIPARAPVWLLEAFRERHGDRWAERLRELMQKDLQG